MAKLLSNRTADKLRSFLQREAGRLAAEIPPPAHRDYPQPNWQHVRVLSSAIQTVNPNSDSDSDSDISDQADFALTYYAGRVEVWNASQREMSQYGDVWVVDANGDTLTTGRIYTCRQSGNVSLHLQCSAFDSDSDIIMSDSDSNPIGSDSDSEAVCNSDSDTTYEMRPLFVNAGGGGEGCTDFIEVELPIDVCLLQGTPPA